LEKAYCRFCTYGIKILTNAFARKFFGQRVAFSQIRNLEFTEKKLLKLVSICRHKSEQNYSEKEVPEKRHILWMMLSKQGALYI